MTIGRGLDSGQVIEASFDPLYDVINVRNISGTLVPDVYDQIDLTYVPSGPGAGQIQTAIYKLQSVTIATLTISYDGSNRISSVVRT